jgi:O-antigen/teichoic acid export membrane protein
VVEGERLTQRPEPGVARPDTDLLDTPAAGAAAIRGGAVRLAGYAGGVAFALASIPLLVRHLGVVDFGRYTLVVSIIAMVQGLTEGGLQAIGVREYSILPAAERNLMMGRLVSLRVLATVTGVALALVFCVIAGYDSEILLGTLVAGGGLLLLVLFNLLSVPLAANLRFGWVTAVDLARQGLATVLIIALVVAGAGIVPLLAVQIPAGVLAVALTFTLVRNMTSLRPSYDAGAWWALMRDTLPYAIAIAVSALYFRITIVILSLVSSDEATGFFATSYRIIEVLIGIPLLVVAAVFPVLARAARDDAARLRYASQRTLDLMLVLGVWVSLAVAVAAHFIIEVIAGGDFEPSGEVLRIQALAVCCTFVSVTCGFILLSLHRHKAILVGNIVPLAFGVTLTLILAPAHGANGAAGATVIGEAGLAIAMLSHAIGKAEGRVPLSLSAFPQVALAAGLAALAAVLLLPHVHDVAAVIVASLVYFGVLYPLGLIPSELRDALLAGRRVKETPAA